MRDSYTFSQVPVADIPRSTFNRSHRHKTTFDSAFLVPVFVDEALPGDTFNVSASMFARLATPAVPIMDNLHLDCFFFAVPNRLLWDNWQKFCGEQDNPGDSTDYLVPVVLGPAGGFSPHTLADYFGVPTGRPFGPAYSALFARAYNLIWNEWFRDENLQTRATVPKGDGPDTASTYTLRKRGKRHDYFTSCLPWPQKGPGVELSLGTTAPVIADPSKTQGPVFDYYDRNVSSPVTGANTHLQLASNTASPLGTQTVAPNTGALPAFLTWDDPALLADLSNATAVTINSLRESFQIQRLLERDARGGTRYTEILRSHFGVVSPDFRLQRPEYLGGGSLPVIVNPVVQTSSTDATTPQGNLAAFATVAGSGLGFSKSFTEHSVIIGLINVRADLSYQQGLPRMFSRRTRYDFYWPALAHLGEQAVLNKEIYYEGNGAPADDEVFGYQERWAEYRYGHSKITGKFRSTDAASLDFWHLAQEFTERPALNDTFITENPPVSRVLAVTDEPQFIFDSHFAVKCTRPMPTYSVPGMIDHF